MDILTNEQCCEAIGWKQSETYKPNNRVWHLPDGTWYQEPRFHNSLDACFKWLVPWLNNKKIYVESYQHVPTNEFGYSFYGEAGIRIKLNSGTDTSTSIAFIKAFTQMVNK